MKYIAIIILCILGFVELALRGLISLCSLFILLMAKPSFMDCECFDLAQRLV